MPRRKLTEADIKRFADTIDCLWIAWGLYSPETPKQKRPCDGKLFEAIAAVQDEFCRADPHAYNLWGYQTSMANGSRIVPCDAWFDVDRDWLADDLDDHGKPKGVA